MRNFIRAVLLVIDVQNAIDAPYHAADGPRNNWDASDALGAYSSGIDREPEHDGAAMATECTPRNNTNPGSSPCASILLALNMTCTLFGRTPGEALSGAAPGRACAGALDDIGDYGRCVVSQASASSLSLTWMA